MHLDHPIVVYSSGIMVNILPKYQLEFLGTYDFLLLIRLIFLQEPYLIHTDNKYKVLAVLELF